MFLFTLEYLFFTIFHDNFIFFRNSLNSFASIGNITFVVVIMIIYFAFKPYFFPTKRKNVPTMESMAYSYYVRSMLATKCKVEEIIRTTSYMPSQHYC